MGLGDVLRETLGKGVMVDLCSSRMLRRTAALWYASSSLLDEGTSCGSCTVDRYRPVSSTATNVKKAVLQWRRSPVMRFSASTVTATSKDVTKVRVTLERMSTASPMNVGCRKCSSSAATMMARRRMCRIAESDAQASIQNIT